MREHERTMKLHPLHTPEWLNQIVVETGCYPNIARRTGRTTALALRTVAKAIDNPGQVIQFRDHHGTHEADRHMGRLISDIISNQGLQHMHVNLNECTLVFENRKSEGPANGEYVRWAMM